jgi:hypothetical protein
MKKLLLILIIASSSFARVKLDSCKIQYPKDNSGNQIVKEFSFDFKWVYDEEYESDVLKASKRLRLNGTDIYLYANNVRKDKTSDSIVVNILDLNNKVTHSVVKRTGVTYWTPKKHEIIYKQYNSLRAPHDLNDDSFFNQTYIMCDK